MGNLPPKTSWTSHLSGHSWNMPAQCGTLIPPLSSTPSNGDNEELLNFWGVTIRQTSNDHRFGMEFIGIMTSLCQTNQLRHHGLPSIPTEKLIHPVRSTRTRDSTGLHYIELQGSWDNYKYSFLPRSIRYWNCPSECITNWVGQYVTICEFKSNLETFCMYSYQKFSYTTAARKRTTQLSLTRRFTDKPFHW